jgi:hypothetical protein
VDHTIRSTRRLLNCYGFKDLIDLLGLGEAGLDDMDARIGKGIGVWFHGCSPDWFMFPVPVKVQAYRSREPFFPFRQYLSVRWRTYEGKSLSKKAAQRYLKYRSSVCWRTVRCCPNRKNDRHKNITKG